MSYNGVGNFLDEVGMVDIVAAAARRMDGMGDEMVGSFML
jgi:hypothetical protein